MQFLDTNNTQFILINRLNEITENKYPLNVIKQISNRLIVEIDLSLSSPGSKVSKELLIDRLITQLSLNFNNQNSYQNFINLIKIKIENIFKLSHEHLEDFIVNLEYESYRSFRKKFNIDVNYKPKLRLEIAECLAFFQRYCFRKIPKTKHPLFIVRAKSWIKTSLNGIYSNTFAIDALPDADFLFNKNTLLTEEPKDITWQDVKNDFVKYLVNKKQYMCIQYLYYYIHGYKPYEIAKQLKVDDNERDNISERLKYWARNFFKQSSPNDSVKLF
jgi:hypothetical protein